jgi:hypothetical protein
MGIGFIIGKEKGISYSSLRDWGMANLLLPKERGSYFLLFL